MIETAVKEILLNGGVGILPTDTIYGIVGSAFSKKAVARIYKLRKRNLKKPLIILVSSLKDLNIFGIQLDAKIKNFLRKLWPGKISIILPCPDKKFYYLHRRTKFLAFRLPKKPDLIKLLKETGPLVAPSANWEGFPPASTIKEAKRYFKNTVDFYVDGGKLIGGPSALIQIKGGKIEVLRSGGFYKCNECGFHYLNKRIAEKCEQWCKKNKSCNLEITKEAVENFF